MVAVGKPKAMPMRGQRTATNMMKKSSRGKWWLQRKWLKLAR
jgi:hypothetical protein